MDFLTDLLYLLGASDPLGVLFAGIGGFIGAFVIAYAVKHGWILKRLSKPKESKTG